MKQYYESEVLFQLMERDGLNIPSSVPPYEADIKAYLINQVKQAYPKLTDYEAEWLLYNYTKHLPAEFPVSSVSDVTEATFENVVPFAYQSAILSGNTLVNLIGEKREYDAAGAKTLYGWEFMLPYNLTSGKTYLAIFDVSGTIDESNSKVYLMDNGFNSLSGNTTSTIPTFSLGHNVVKCIATNDKHKVLRIRTTYNKNEKFTLSNVMLIEYQEGMENWDIPYFEGMQSVRMPVLTTTGKNLFDGEIELGNISGTGELIDGNQSVRSKNFIKVESNTDYTFSNDKGYSLFILELDENKEVLTNATRSSFKTNPNTKYLIFRTSVGMVQNDLSVKFQLEKGTVATSYEPFKSNILSTPEDVTLRGIGKVQDTLDCLTGEVVERVGEIVLDGSDDESWAIYTNNREKTVQFRFDMKSTAKEQSDYTKIISSHLPSVDIINNNDIEGVSIYSNGNIYISLLRTKAETLSGLKSYLQSNPITVQYELATESIKTVDLTTVNEKGETTHFMPLEGTMSVQSSGEIIQPTFDMTVPIEATTQNLASFIDMEMEE